MESQMVVIGRATVNSNNITWANNGIVYVTREICDSLPEDTKLPLTANTVREFESVVALISRSVSRANI
jgi:hypothetical protein